MTVALNGEGGKTNNRNQQEGNISPKWQRASEFVSPGKNGQDKDHQGDVFKKSLQVGDFQGIPETTAIGDEVVHRIKKCQDRKKDHHGKQQPHGFADPEVEQEADAEREFKDTKEDGQKKCERDESRKVEDNKIIFQPVTESKGIDALYKPRIDKDKSDNDPENSSENFHIKLI